MESDLFFPITCFDWLTSDFSWNSIYSGGICAKQWFTSPFLIFFTSLCFHYIFIFCLCGNKSKADKRLRDGNLKSISWNVLNRWAVKRNVEFFLGKEYLAFHSLSSDGDAGRCYFWVSQSQGPCQKRVSWQTSLGAVKRSGHLWSW